MNQKIGIIDDNKVFRKITKLLILKNGSIEDKDILLFENGKQALDFIVGNIHNSSVLPQTLLLDLNMPVMDGWKFLKLFSGVSKNKYEPNIYIITSSLDTKDIKKAESLSEIKDYIVKPVSADFINSLLKSILIKA